MQERKVKVGESGVMDAEKPLSDTKVADAQFGKDGVGEFLGPVNEDGQRIWKCPAMFNGFKLSGHQYAFRLPDAEDYARLVRGGLRAIMDDPTVIDPVIVNPNYVNPALKLRGLNPFELELVRGAYISFLFNRD